MTLGRGLGDEINALSETRMVPKCLIMIMTTVHFKSQKMGPYMEVTHQNQQAFLYAPIYKYRCDVTMTP